MIKTTLRDNKGRFIKGTKGHPHKHSKKTKKKMSKNYKYHINSGCFRKGCSGFDRKHSKKTKLKIRQNMLNQYKEGKRKPLRYWLNKKSPNYKKGTTTLTHLIRESPESKIWRSKIFERDNWICQTCNKRGVYLEAHHIKEFNKILKINNIKNYKKARKCKELWDINNGVTLCEECHNLTKKWRYKK